jgi:hypothetical protein
MIVGVAIVSMMQLLAAGTVANMDSASLTTGMTLARNVREFSLKLGFTDPSTPTIWGVDNGETGSNPKTYDDVNDMAGRTFSTPIDSSGNALAGFPDWSQVVSVVTVNPSRVTSVVPNGTEPANKVTVSVYRRTEKVCELSWFTFYGAP